MQWSLFLFTFDETDFIYYKILDIFPLEDTTLKPTDLNYYGKSDITYLKIYKEIF